MAGGREWKHGGVHKSHENLPAAALGGWGSALARYQRPIERALQGATYRSTTVSVQLARSLQCLMVQRLVGLGRRIDIH